MADPFEVRMKFTSQLQHLNASVNSAQKAAHYALKHKDMHEDLHSCILEQLERCNMNIRANIMYFIEQLCDMAQRDGQPEFVKMIQRDIFRVVDAVAPSDGSGAANVKVVRRVLTGLQQKSILISETVAELEAGLKERDTLPHDADLSPPAEGDDAAAGVAAAGTAGSTGTDADKAANAQATMGAGAATSTTAGRRNGTSGAGGSRLDKQQIEQRIEEDRERHKRLKESIWCVAHGTEDGDGEFEAVWDACSDIGDDDRMASEEHAEERRKGEDLD